MAASWFRPSRSNTRREDFEPALASLELTKQTHGLKDLIVAVERTGNYHLPALRAFRQASYEVRVLHPYATKHYRQPAHPDDKTDDHDLEAIAQATIVGFALLEKPLGDLYHRLRLLVRHRRDLVQKSAAPPMPTARTFASDPARLRGLVRQALGVAAADDNRAVPDVASRGM